MINKIIPVQLTTIGVVFYKYEDNGYRNVGRGEKL
jgi:hypothetical protein